MFIAKSVINGTREPSEALASGADDLLVIFDEPIRTYENVVQDLGKF